MTDFSGDPYHNNPARPLDHLKGSMTGPNTQQPMTSEAMTNPRSAAADNIGQTWNSTSLAPSAGGTGNNDKAEAH